tara:strand:- start:575 stop:763 length:189 start_codon:yes stop_codon:yes gene_type:complete
MILEVLYKICLGLIFILVTLWFFLHLYNMGSYTEADLSFYYEEFSPFAKNIIAYQNKSNINK